MTTHISTDLTILCALLDRGQPMPCKDLAIEAERHPSVVYRCLTLMERIDVVKRVRDKTGKRDEWSVGKRIRR